MPAHGCLLANETARVVVGSYPDLPSWEEGNSVRLALGIGWARLAQLYIVGASWA